MIRKTLIVLVWGMLAACSSDVVTYPYYTYTEEEESVSPFTEFSFPLAEFQKATTVLVHTPGEELSSQQGHTKVFDVPAMREEHLQYMDVLRQQGIRVFELTDVLRLLPASLLRSTAQKILATDVSIMQKEALIQYMIETPPLKALYFMHDQSFATPRGIIIGKMKMPHRRPESDLLEICYRYLGGEVFYRVEGTESYLEGGDYMPFGTLALIGEGARTNRMAIQELLDADAIGHDTLVVVKDALHDIFQMHLDTYFNIIDRQLVVLSQARLNAYPGEEYYLSADVYTRAPGQTAYRLEQEDVSFVDLLQQRGITIIPISDEDQQLLASNFLCIAPRHIVARENLSAAFRQSMEENGVTVEWVKLDELVEGDGAAHCMTQVLGRQ